MDSNAAISKTSTVATEARIWLDSVTAGLIDAQFETCMENSRAYLLRPRRLQETGRLLLGKPTPCVGRERELSHLEQTFEECVSECAARAVLITAPAGGGKSRLRSEFMRAISARFKNLHVWYAWGDPTRAGSPFGLLSQALGNALGVVDGERLEVAQQKIRDCVGTRLASEDCRRVTEFHVFRELPQKLA